jgi:hypothetical protein
MLKLFWIVCVVSLLIAVATAGKDYYDVREKHVRYRPLYANLIRILVPFKTDPDSSTRCIKSSNQKGI